MEQPPVRHRAEGGDPIVPRRSRRPPTRSSSTQREVDPRSGGHNEEGLLGPGVPPQRTSKIGEFFVTISAKEGPTGAAVDRRPLPRLQGRPAARRCRQRGAGLDRSARSARQPQRRRYRLRPRRLSLYYSRRQRRGRRPSHHRAEPQGFLRLDPADRHRSPVQRQALRHPEG